MRAYIIRRLLLIPPTLIGMTLLVFFIIRFTPGGPMEQAMLEARMKSQGERGGSTRGQSSGLTPAQELKLEEQYGHDKPFHIAYAAWLGAVAKETNRARSEFAADQTETEISIPGTAYYVKVRRTDTGVEFASEALPRQESIAPLPESLALKTWKVRLLTPEVQLKKWQKRNPGATLDAPLPYMAIMYQPQFAGVLQGDLGNSTRYSEPVWDMMKRRFPISLFYGLTALLITYAVCIPLGVIKAIKHRTALDSGTSVLIFFGYSIPNYVLGVILVIYLAGRKHWFPLEGFVSPEFNELSALGKVWDILHHAALPLVCYVAGSFAYLSMMVKNNLLEQLASDYVRTAVAKGRDFRHAVTGHALRNAFIPIAATMGQAVTVLVAGSFLIERIFDIDGFGLMGFNALLEKDYPIVMGTVTIGGLLLMLGNVLSDIITARVDPRIRFE